MSPVSVSLGVIIRQLFRWRTAKKPDCGADKTGARSLVQFCLAWGSSSLQCHCSASKEQTHGFNTRTEGTLSTKVEQGRHRKVLLPEMCSFPGLWDGWYLQTEAPAEGSIHTSLKDNNRTHQKQPPNQLHKFCMGQEQSPVCLVLPGLCVMLPIKCLAKWHSWLSPFPHSLFSLTLLCLCSFKSWGLGQH